MVRHGLAGLLVGLSLAASSACADPCDVVVDKVCGPGTGEERVCWNEGACRNALDLRATTATAACEAALSDEDSYPRCRSCEEPAERSGPPSSISNPFDWSPCANE